MDINRQINQGNNSTYNEINHIIINSADYKELLSDIEELKDDIQNTDDTAKQIRKHDKLAKKEALLEQMKKTVLELHKKFTTIPINTARLKAAKDYFDKGKFREADAILKEEEISKEIDHLKSVRNQKEIEISEIDEKLEDKANEFLIKAQIWKTFYAQPNWFEKTIAFYEKALDASRSASILFEFAHFLQEHNQFNKALEKYQEALMIRRALAKDNRNTYLPYVAMTLNNLANLQKTKNEFPDALEKYQEALRIRRALAKDNPNTYLPHVAMTLINLSIFHLQDILNKEKSTALALEVIEIAIKFQQIPSVQQYVDTARQILQANGYDVDELLRDKE